MLLFSEFMSTMSSSAVALLRLTMSATTPGCGISAMSGALLAWMEVITSWLMLLTFFHVTVIPCFFAWGSSCCLKPSMTGWSRLAQIVTLLSSLPPLPLLPPQAARPLDARTTAMDAVATERPRLVTRMCLLLLEIGEAKAGLVVLEITTERVQQIITVAQIGCQARCPDRPYTVGLNSVTARAVPGEQPSCTRDA